MIALTDYSGLKPDAYLYDYHYFWSDKVSPQASFNRKDSRKSDYTGMQHYRNERPLILMEKIIDDIDRKIETLKKEIQGPTDSSEEKARIDELRGLKVDLKRGMEEVDSSGE